MTDKPPAMPELPEPDYWSTRDDDTPLYTADQMRAYALAALQSAQPAEVSDETIVKLASEMCYACYSGMDHQFAGMSVVKFARAILALRPAQQATSIWINHDLRDVSVTPQDEPGWVQFDVEVGALPDTQQATPEPVGEPMAYREKLTGRLCEPEDAHRRKFPMCYEPLFTRPAPGVPDVEAAAKKLAECMDYPWEHMPSAGRDNMRKHAEAVLAAAQAKGGGHG